MGAEIATGALVLNCLQVSKPLAQLYSSSPMASAVRACLNAGQGSMGKVNP